MDLGNQLILVAASLVLLSIIAGLVSSRIGAPLLLVFLGLGMLAGEEGPGHIRFDNFHMAYIIGSASLAVVLFDGGLRTRAASLRIALWPAILLASVGVFVTAGIVGIAAHFFAHLAWLQALLVGSIVASTDAAAVFLLLHLNGMGLQRRVRATLEVESGMNDPMAIFLTIACVELLVRGGPAYFAEHGWGMLAEFAMEMIGGAVVGLLGGRALALLVNRLTVAPGLYPILVLAGAMFLFGGAQSLGASGYLAVYVAGLVLGGLPHRAEQGISRFHDGMAWLAQIAMFLMLGLLVTPSLLLRALEPALAIAAVLMLLARPIAVALCLVPLRFRPAEIIFVSWVGLRGAVPIFLATVPVLAGVPGGRFFFDVAFVVVLASLVLQGWTVAVASRTLRLDLPPEPEEPTRTEIDLPAAVGRNVTGYTVGADARAIGQHIAALALPPGAEVMAVFRDGVQLQPVAEQKLSQGDYLLVLAPPDRAAVLDRLFAARPVADAATAGLLGEFEVDGDAAVSTLMALYDLPAEPEDQGLRIGELLRRRIGRQPVEGDRVRFGPMMLIVSSVEDDRIRRVGLQLDPEALPRGVAAWPARLQRLLLRRRPAPGQ